MMPESRYRCSDGPLPSSTRDEDDMEHRVRTERCAGVGRARWPGIWVMTATLVGAVSAWAKLETWRQEGAAAFSKHHRERVVISDQGHARLGQALLPTGPLAAE